jgi:outer membrane protein
MRFFHIFLMSIVAVLFTGCYQFMPPPAAVDGDTFTQRKESKRYMLPAEVQVLSMRQAQRISVLNNPDYMSAVQAVNQAKAIYQRSFHTYMPKVSANFDIGASHDNFRNQKNTDLPNNSQFTTQTGVGATWLIFDGLSRTMNMLSAKYSYKEQKALQDDTRRILLRAISFAYNNILLAIEENRIATEDMKFQLEVLRETQFKFEAGAVPLSDVLNFKIMVNRAMNGQIEAQFQYNIARFALARLMGLPKGALDNSIKYSPINLAIDSMLAPAEIYLDTALNNRPDLIAYRQQLKSAQYSLYSRWGAFSPTVNAYVNLALDTNRTKFGSSSTRPNTGYNNPNLSYGMQVDWVLFEGGKRWFDVRIAQTQLAQAKYSVASKWIEVVSDVRNAHDNYQQSAKKANLFKETLSLVEKQRDLVKEEYDAGNTELTRLNEAQRDKVQAETDFISALVNMRNARAQLDAATNANDTGAFLNISEFRDETAKPIKSKEVATRGIPGPAAKTKVIKVNPDPTKPAPKKNSAKPVPKNDKAKPAPQKNP